MEEEKPALDSQLWHACAGGMVQMPPINSKVYYFPQGHAEHAATPPDFGANIRTRPATLCSVLSVNYFADTETDEVYARMRLLPIRKEEEEAVAEEQVNKENNTTVAAPTSFAKTLTQSDANNGGGFSVPRYCAETIFPPLDYSNDPPVQTVLAKDVHGAVWKFRHIYRGTPRRHLLTTGWSTFVNHKKLVAGDAIVFLRFANGELCVGVRRSNRTTVANSSFSVWHLPGSGVPPPHPPRSSRWVEVKAAETYSFCGSAGDGVGGFARNRGRVSANCVIEAATLATAGEAFEVVYYPRASTPEFCVKSHSVRSALRIQWTAGMRFKMSFETEDFSRISWFMGTISSVHVADPLLWPNSPWHILQVTWDEPDLVQNVKRVSPWLVEVVSNMPTTQMTPFTLPKKKLRVTQPVEFQLEGKGMMGIQMGTLGNNMLGQINPWHDLSNNVPAGMQGARHDCVFGINFSDFRTDNGQNNLFFDKLYDQELGSMSTCVSTELNIGNSSQFNEFGAKSSISCLLTIGNSSQSEQKASSAWTGSSTTKGTPFLLFGKAIITEQPRKLQQQQQPVMSSSDGPGFYMLNENASPGLTSNSSTDGNQEIFDRMQHLINAATDSPKPFDNSALQCYHGESLDYAGMNGMRGLQWFKDQATRLMLEKDGEENTFEGSIVHCKVFKETEEVGRTLDLSLFGTYEQLFDRLSKMFDVKESELSNRVLYKGLGGSLRHAGDEPYKDFMKTVRRITILSDSGSDNMAR